MSQNTTVVNFHLTDVNVQSYVFKHFDAVNSTDRFIAFSTYLVVRIEWADPQLKKKASPISNIICSVFLAGGISVFDSQDLLG